MLTFNNYKIEKTNNTKENYLVAILHLSPHKASGYNTCQFATTGCSTSCLFTSGFGKQTKVKEARNKRTKMFFEQREEFDKILIKDIEALIRKATKENKTPGLRLNGTSDLPWEKTHPELFSKFPQVQFWDYTKDYKRMMRFIKKDFPNNYHLTFSRSESNWKDCSKVLKSGGNVAVVFQQLPSEYKRYEVINGDEHDLRFLDPHCIVGLTPKGKAKSDITGFVIRNVSTSNIIKSR